MSHVYIMGDMHLGVSDKALKRWWPFWKSAKEHDDTIIANWNAVIAKNDLVFVLGDIGNDLLAIQKLNGRKILIAGNHDERKAIEYIAIAGFEDVRGFIKYKKAWLSHCPIHPAELRGCIVNIHGHTHAGGPEGPYFNTCAEWINHTPIAYKEIEAKFI